MTAIDLLSTMWAAGLTVRLNTDRALVISPASALQPGQRDLLRAHKAEVVALLSEAHDTTQALLAAAARVCDQHNDAAGPRADMCRDCLNTPPALRQDLLQHLLQASRKEGAG